MLLLAPLVLLAAARSRMSRLKRRERALHVRLLARCERTAEALRPLLLPRQALTLHNKELGVGHFGRVRLGLLRLPHRPPTAVAAKVCCLYDSVESYIYVNKCLSLSISSHRTKVVSCA